MERLIDLLTEFTELAEFRAKARRGKEGTAGLQTRPTQRQSFMLERIAETEKEREENVGCVG